MIWFGKSFIKFCKSFINSIKLVSTRTCRLARVRTREGGIFIFYCKDSSPHDQ